MTARSDSVVVLRAPLVAGYGGREQRDWKQARPAVLPADVQPASSSEDTAGRQVTVTSWSLFAGPEADGLFPGDEQPGLLATDRVVWDGLTLEVDGDVGRWKNRGVLHHVEAALRRAQG